MLIVVEKRGSVSVKYKGQHAIYNLACKVCGVTQVYEHDVDPNDEPDADQIEEDGLMHLYLTGCTDPKCKHTNGISYKEVK